VAKKKRSIGSVKNELITKSREAALTAIKTFNDPLVTFKGETFIVLMVIAWTYMLHAYYRSKRIEYRYFRQGPKRRIFDKSKRGAYKYWELERCLHEKWCPIDNDAINNLKFLIGLRHEIEHQMTRSLDGYLSGRYQACSLNYNDYLKKLFGKKFGIDNQLTYSIQFMDISEEQIRLKKHEEVIPKRIRSYIAEFDGALTHDEYNSPRYAYRLLFKRKMVNKPGQADRVCEFIDPNSDIAKTIDKEYWVKKEVERPKFRAKDVVEAVQKEGFSKFRINPEHVEMWKSEDAKNPGKGYGVEVTGYWYWYERWIDRCLELCEAAGNKYRDVQPEKEESEKKKSKSVVLKICDYPFIFVPLSKANFNYSDSVYTVICVNKDRKWSFLDVKISDEIPNPLKDKKFFDLWLNKCETKNVWVGSYIPNGRKISKKKTQHVKRTILQKYGLSF
jgi:Domain of unknown function (DUF3644)